ncbi:helix-turn-helix domain-containing protein [Bradyrhizobium sp. USDA 4518]
MKAADILKVSRTTAYQMVNSGSLPARQPCKRSRVGRIDNDA